MVFVTLFTSKKLRKILTASPFECAAIVLMFLVLGYAAMPQQVKADVDTTVDMRSVALEVDAIQNAFKSYGQLPESDLRGPAYTITVPATAYNSLVGQTDSTPFTTASGTTTRHGVIAANFLPIGTRIKIPEIYGDDVFIVEDRMNARYWYKIDIWMEHYDDAIQFGLQDVTIEVYPNS